MPTLLKIFLTVWSALLIFFLGRLTVFIQNSFARIPPYVVTDSSVTVPVIVIDEWDSQHLRGHGNMRELRFEYDGDHIISNFHGVFEIQRRL